MYDILELYRVGADPFDRPDAVVPQDPRHMPQTLEVGSRLHRLLLFHINYYMRGGVDSVTAVKAMSKIFDEHPEYYLPEYAINLDPEVLSQALQAVGLNYRKSQTPQFWVENARRLVERYDADPGNIFLGLDSWDEAVRRIRNDHRGNGFKGFQHKMVSMIIYYFMDAGFVSPFNFPIPVDIHVARVTLANEIVKVYGDQDSNVYTDTVLDAIRNFYLWCAEEAGLEPLELCNAVWLYSKAKCADNPEAEWRQEGEFDNRSTVLYKKDLLWDQTAAINQWLRACGTCRFSTTCNWNVPAGPYYKWGEIKLNDRRLGPQGFTGNIIEPADLASGFRYVRKANVTAAADAPPNPNQLGFDLD